MISPLVKKERDIYKNWLAVVEERSKEISCYIQENKDNSEKCLSELFWGYIVSFNVFLEEYKNKTNRDLGLKWQGDYFEELFASFLKAYLYWRKINVEKIRLNEDIIVDELEGGKKKRVDIYVENDKGRKCIIELKVRIDWMKDVFYEDFKGVNLNDRRKNVARIDNVLSALAKNNKTSFFFIVLSSHGKTDVKEKLKKKETKLGKRGEKAGKYFVIFENDPQQKEAECITIHDIETIFEEIARSLK